MSDEEPLNVPNSEDMSYSFAFRQHLTDIQAHLAGTLEEELLPSYIPPTGYWTPLEKDIFFHSLRIYSRLRPDLVAACIGTKTVFDVCAYIETLDGALSRDVHILLPRSDLEVAQEVSNAWVRREEHMSEDLITVEPIWERSVLQSRREEDVIVKGAHPRHEVPGGEVSLEDDGTWEHNKRRHWSQEDSLCQLDCHYLAVMDRLLKDAEYGDLDVEGIPPEDQVSVLIPIPSSPPDVQPSGRILQTTLVSNDMINPVLFYSPQPSVPGQHPQQQFQRLPHVEHPHDMHSAPNVPSSPDTPPAPAVCQPSVHARPPSPAEGDRESTTDPPDLSPSSRRRLRKRLYMRRKRATQRGEEVTTAVTKLRPGRKLKERDAGKLRRNSESKPVLGDGDGQPSNDPMDVDNNTITIASPISLGPLGALGDEETHGGDDGNNSDSSEVRRHSKGGMTKPYKVQKEFESRGITAETLIEGNLGLFHLTTLSRLMTLYRSGYGTKGSVAATAISADTLRLLTAIIVEFTAEVIQRTIVFSEQAKAMKEGIKVYHQTRDEISNEHVAHVLDMMGMKGQSKARYFAQFLGDDMPETPEEDNEVDLPTTEYDSDHDESGSAEDSGEEEGEGEPSLEIPTFFAPPLSLHREICPPLLHLPKSILPRTSTGRGATTTSEEPLMPDETDDEELLEELEAERDLDEADRVIAHAYEADLWKQYGRK